MTDRNAPFPAQDLILGDYAILVDAIKHHALPGRAVLRVDDGLAIVGTFVVLPIEGLTARVRMPNPREQISF